MAARSVEVRKYGERGEMMNVYEARQKGRAYCQTEGSEHYKGEVEPMDLIISLGLAEGFCRGSAIKYISRFGVTRKPADLRKAADYLHILCGLITPKEENV